ncbi:hypothetical protein CEXT_725491 [Caerostris extrusa]|uniref:Uncharacterized protein n=1 Tax=Caerostris extrusa TaxID=172846 RepID=A0AAV4Y9A4_CAEEX|nr:hypothetical protein CEXT_725491 [Caerostris extrusa]
MTRDRRCRSPSPNDDDEKKIHESHQKSIVRNVEYRFCGLIRSDFVQPFRRCCHAFGKKVWVLIIYFSGSDQSRWTGCGQTDEHDLRKYMVGFET